ncbi:MAG: guanylate kinase, partial [Pseudomonadota bacterium]|nr:guanylate kinase [Pseudomonadota bacterium]
MQNTGLKRRGLMFVLSSPSGAGKTTITRALLEKNPDATMSISATTRPRRAGEVHGQDYFFVDMAEFNEMVSKGDMLEHAKVFGNYYGTPRGPVEDALNDGKDIIFDIDWQGTQQLAEIARDDLVTVFVLPPSSEELERRLNNRARDTREKQEDIKGRMAKAADEMSHYSEYDYVLINKDIDETIKSAQMILD